MKDESAREKPGRGGAGHGDSGNGEDRFWKTLVAQVGTGPDRSLDLDEAEFRMAHGADEPIDEAVLADMVREVTCADLSSERDAGSVGQARLRALAPLSDDSEAAADRAPTSSDEPAKRPGGPWVWLLGGAAAAAIAGVSFMKMHWDSRQDIRTLHHEVAQELLEDPFQRMEDLNLAVGRLGVIALDCIEALQAVENSDAAFFGEVRVRLAYLAEVVAGDAAALEVPGDPRFDLLPGGGVESESEVLLTASESLARRREALHRLTALASQAIEALLRADPPEQQLRISRDAGLARIRRLLDR